MFIFEAKEMLILLTVEALEAGVTHSWCYSHTSASYSLTSVSERDWKITLSPFKPRQMGHLKMGPRRVGTSLFDCLKHKAFCNLLIQYLSLWYSRLLYKNAY